MNRPGDEALLVVVTLHVVKIVPADIDLVVDVAGVEPAIRVVGRVGLESVHEVDVLETQVLLVAVGSHRRQVDLERGIPCDRRRAGEAQQSAAPRDRTGQVSVVVQVLIRLDAAGPGLRQSVEEGNAEAQVPILRLAHDMEGGVRPFAPIV